MYHLQRSNRPPHTSSPGWKERVARVAEFMEALNRIADGGTAIDPEMVAQLLTRTRADSGLERLSPRERDVLALMAEGLGNGAIAERLVVTDGAVHKHNRGIFAKLGRTAVLIGG